MSRYLSYKEECERLQKLLAEVSTDEKSLNEEDEEIVDEELISDHLSNSEEELDSDSEVYVCESTDDNVGKDGKTIWHKKEPRKNVRTPAHNIISKLPGNIDETKNVSSPINSWTFLIDESMISIIVECTNIFIRSIACKFGRERDAHPTKISEIKAFIGLLYFGGLHKSSHVNVKDLWATDGTGIDIFHRTMSYKRFLFLMRCVRFDDIRDRSSRREVDKLAPIRNIFEMFVANCQKVQTLGEYVTIDEKLEPFRGRCSFRQYMPNKPAKYGIKIFALVDARTFYTWNLEIYAGIQPAGPYNVENGPDKIVKRLLEPIFNSGRNLTVDNWYTSYDLAKDLLKKKITLVGTVRKNKRELPKEFISGRKREQYSTLFGFQKNLTKVSYVPKKNKCVVLLSSMHNGGTIDASTGEAKKPEIITFYNLTKGAVDVVDEMSATYSTARISKRWPMVIFFSMLNIATVNSRIILLSSNTPPVQYKKRSLFKKDLSLELLKDHLQERSMQATLPRQLRDQLNCNRSENCDTPPQKKQKISRKRCHVCPNTKDRKSQMCCSACKKNVCGEHSSVVCCKCL
ncbi:piggyBac transposable element-derived protein 4-like [Argiope bruennichi]|uniref:piggyBac transposable element-derived protein 4-like n=1 Tax=Argiope bruennichi TaxID=94029 RepID=UPI00249460F5|nr:piggyBac transposable element-derived protein 4-like [Argiope bruennichi]